MKYCRYCGAQLNDSAVFCSNCGRNTYGTANENNSNPPKTETQRVAESPAPTPAAKRKKARIIIISVMIVALLAVGGIILASFLNGTGLPDPANQSETAQDGTSGKNGAKGDEKENDNVPDKPEKDDASDQNGQNGAGQKEPEKDRTKENEAAKLAFNEVTAQYEGACALHGWDGEEGTTYTLVNNYMMHNYHTYGDTSFYRAYYDINGDGVTELLIGAKDKYEFEIVDLYYCTGGKPLKLIDDSSLGDRAHVSVFRDGTVYWYGSSGASTGSSMFMQLGEDGRPVILREFDIDFEKYPSTPYVSSDEKLTRDEYEAYLNGFKTVSESSINWVLVADVKQPENIVGTWILYGDLNKDVPLGEDISKYGAIMYLTDSGDMVYYVGKEWKTGKYRFGKDNLTTVYADLTEYYSETDSKYIGESTMTVSWEDGDLVIKSAYKDKYTLKWSRTITGNPELPTYDGIYHVHFDYTEERKDLNVFLSNFSEAYFKTMKSFADADPYDLVWFTFLHAKINNWSAISSESGYYTISADTVDMYLERFFGSTVSHRTYSKTSSSGNTETIEFLNGKYRFPGADGENYNILSVSTSADEISDGLVRVKFSVYRVANGGEIDSAYYSMTANEAASSSKLSYSYSGTAEIYRDVAGEYRLKSYSRD